MSLSFLHPCLIFTKPDVTCRFKEMTMSPCRMYGSRAITILCLLNTAVISVSKRRFTGPYVDFWKKKGGGVVFNVGLQKMGGGGGSSPQAKGGFVRPPPPPTHTPTALVQCIVQAKTDLSPRKPVVKGPDSWGWLSGERGSLETGGTCTSVGVLCMSLGLGYGLYQPNKKMRTPLDGHS